MFVVIYSSSDPGGYDMALARAHRATRNALETVYAVTPGIARIMNLRENLPAPGFIPLWSSESLLNGR